LLRFAGGSSSRAVINVEVEGMKFTLLVLDSAQMYAFSGISTFVNRPLPPPSIVLFLTSKDVTGILGYDVSKL
jgi:hypothetical protein